MVIESRVVQFSSEVILVISNQISAARLFDFEIMHMISAQIALHSVQLPLVNSVDKIKLSCYPPINSVSQFLQKHSQV